MRRLALPLAALGVLTAGAAVAQGSWADSAVTILLQQAQFWADQHKPDAARESLRRLLLLAPANPDALAALTALDAAPGRPAAAGAALDQARALAATPNGWEAARDRLAALVRADPADLAAQLAYAETLTRRDGARADGLARLKALALLPPVADAAREALRRAQDATPAASAGRDPPAGALLAPRDEATAGELAARIAGGDRDPGLPLLLAEAQVRLGRQADAEQTLRAALARRPDDGRAMVQLAGLLDREGRAQDAALLLARAQAAGAGPLVAEARARTLRGQAQAATDPAERLALLRAASAQAPGDAWIRLDLARALVAGGRLAEARSEMAAAVPDGAAADALRAGIVFANETRDPAAAATLSARLARGTPPLSPAQAADTTQLRAGQAIRRADRLNEQGRPAAAFDALAPALAAQPADPALSLALARLYANAGRPREAMALAETVLRRNPADAAARQQAVAAALAAGETQRARSIVREGLQMAPRDPQSWLASADLARALGDNDTALRSLRRARLLRAGQLAATEPSGSGASTAAPPGTVLAMVGPDDLGPDTLSAPPPSLTNAAGPEAASDTETDEDGDAVFVRRRMLDTDVTDLPVPAGRAVAAAPATPAPVADTRPPLPVVIAASIPSADAGPAPGFDTGPFGRTGTAAASPPPANPFPAGADDDAAAPQVADLAATATPADPMTARIDRDIAGLTDQPTPSAQAGVGFRGRSGVAGTSQLAEITVPLEADFAAGGSGQIRLSVTPTFLDAGSASRSNGSTASHTASGAGLDLGYAIGDLTADIGTTPLGFAQQNVVGGVEWAPSVDGLLGEGTRLRLTGERRAVTDSVLSYAGSRDAQSGQDWGGVTYASGHADLEFSAGPADLYVGGGGGVRDGRNVRSNTEIEAGAGGSMPVLSSDRQELRLGLDLVYAAFAKNLGGFTLGQGGYFSPQSYFAALLPVTFKDRPTERLSYEIGATVGVQSYHEDSSPTFPNNAGLQAALDAQQANPATAVAGVATTFPGHNATGFSGGAHGSVDYRLTPGFHVGAKVDYEHTGNFNQTVGLLYGRYVLDGARDR